MSHPQNEMDAVELAEKLGITRQAVEKLLRGGSTEMKASHNARAAQLLNVDPTWLATGEGVPQPGEFHIRWHERRLIDMFRQLPEDEQDEFASMLELRCSTHRKHAGTPGADPFNGVQPPEPTRGTLLVDGTAPVPGRKIRRAK
jgi:transcriptional regulator with XRE-family HTH domain